MALDPSIILQGRPANVLGAMAQGMQLRAAETEMRRQNALADLYQRSGSGLLSGDATAYNALAAMDPTMALNLQSALLGQDATRADMRIADERLGMDRETHALQVAAANRGPAPDLHAVDGYGVVDYTRLMQGGDPSGAVVLPERQAPAEVEWNHDLGTYVRPDAQGVPQPVVGAPVMQPGSGVDPSDAASIRKEYTSNPAVAGFVGRAQAYQGVQAAASAAISTDSPMADMSLIFNFMKMLDPDSAVREGEYASAEQTAGLPAQVVNLYNRAVTGQRLNNDQRQAFMDEAKNQLSAFEPQYVQARDYYIGQGQRLGLTGADFFDYRVQAPLAPQPQPGGAQPQVSGQPQQAPAQQQNASQPGTYQGPTVQDVATMTPDEITTAIADAQASGNIIPADVRAAMRRRLAAPQPQGGQ